MPNKTQPTKLSVTQFLEEYPNPKCTQDYLKLDQLFQKTTNYKPVLWGRIVGYGTYHYTYASGREGDWMISGFTPSKTGMTVYLMFIGLEVNYPGLTPQGIHLGSKQAEIGCLVNI